MSTESPLGDASEPARSAPGAETISIASDRSSTVEETHAGPVCSDPGTETDSPLVRSEASPETTSVFRPSILAEAAAALRARAMPPNTARAYRACWQAFYAWCQGSGRSAMPASAETLSEYIAHLDREGNRVRTIGVAMAAIDSAHGRLGESSGRHDPLVRQTLRGLARKQAGIPPSETRKSPLTADLLAQVVSAIGTRRLVDLRDRAMLLVGFASACRNSEVLALERSDVELRDEGAILRIRKSKTDPDGTGALVEVYPGRSPELCPVGSLRTWLERSGIASGALFRNVTSSGRMPYWAMSSSSFRLMVKARCQKAGLDPKLYSAHSLRSGFATSASFAGKPLERIMQTTRHKSADVARQYVRQGELLKDGAGKGLL